MAAGWGLFISNIDQQAVVIRLASLLPASVLDASLHQWMVCRDRLLTVASVNRELLLTEQLLAWETRVKPLLVDSTFKE